MYSSEHEVLAQNPEAEQVLPPEKALMREVVAGSASAFAELYALHAAPIHRYLWRFVGNEALADDILQEVFLKVFLMAYTYDTRNNLKSWLYSIARHTACDSVRKSNRRHEVSIATAPAGTDSDRVSFGDLIESHEPPCDAHITQTEGQRIIDEEVAALSPEHRDVVVGFYRAGKRYSQIAEEQCIPVGTVKSRLHAALDCLRKNIIMHYPEYASDPCISPAPKRVA